MTDRPIIFSAPMILAMLDGRKTQTRRLANSPLRVCRAGDRLYVREAWRTLQKWDSVRAGALMDDRSKITFEADPWNRQPLWAFGKLRPSIHMPRWASRLTLIVAGVMIEPLQSISRVDCVAEGHPRSDAPMPEEVHLDAARDWYMDLWDSLHPDNPWASNPPVVAIEFEVKRGNIDG